MARPSMRIHSNLFQDRDVQRAGWLKYIPFAERVSDEHKFWVVFAIYDTTVPYLEFYQQRQSPAPSEGPISKHSLLSCRHIAPVITHNQNESPNEFSVTLETHVIRLVADTAEVMFDWIESLKAKLIQLNLLKPAENVYSKSPTISQSNSIDTNGDAANEAGTNELYEPIFELPRGVQQLSLDGRSPRLPSEEGPPPYECIFTYPDNHRPTSSMSFRESQVDKLKKEMEVLTGVTLKVRRKDCYNAIAFVDILTYGVYIAGWKQKDHPHLHNSFHIGDQLISINGVAMDTAAQAKEFIKHCSHSLEVIVRRIPFGQVFCLKRLFDGEDLGLVRENGTAEITHIIPHSIAANAGLLAKCSFYNEDNSTNHNWCFTEINNRPLNLFYKNNEVADRLNAIGKEISIVVQPYQFVRRLRKQLKTFKNYKDYIVQ